MVALSADVRRLERLVWAVVAGTVLGAPVALSLTPDSSGPVPLVLAVIGFAVAAPLVFSLFETTASPAERPGEMTATLLAVLLVSVAFHAVLGGVGFGGVAGNALAILVGLVAGRRVTARFARGRAAGTPRRH